ncbi:MAG: DUF2279 domain-containing protein [Flavobacteriales bacterium]|nr:DUF2279 domain-containing protein [Flavobacteriales bacterium]
MRLNLHRILIIAMILVCTPHIAQESEKISFWQPSDSLHKPRLRTIVIGESVATVGAFTGLYYLWYKDYPKSDFHFINDNYEWLQMDKVGHFYSGYHLSRVGAELLNWTGANQKQQLIYGAGLGFALVATVEVFDGFSQEWGASKGDLIADAIGSGLYIGQDLLWKEQRIQPKFSFHQTTYATIRPSVLGNAPNEQLLKDYNGQTYWLSINLHSFIKKQFVPTWLNLAVGYGAEGMITGDTEFINNVFLPEKERVRQYYLSLDVDLSKIKTKNQLLKTFLSNLNMLKIPFPTLEIRADGRLLFHPIYY